MRLPVRATPGAPRTRVLGWRGAALKVAVASPPERGAANAELERFLAEALGLPRGAARVVAGAASRDKTVEIQGLDEAGLARRLGLSPRTR